jgi:hypothetical protein
VRIYNPRRQRWSEHFRWLQDGLLIEGLSPAGRATVDALELNRLERIESRQWWIAAGWHPPED